MTGGVITLEAAPSIPKLVFLLLRDQPDRSGRCCLREHEWRRLLGTTARKETKGPRTGLAINQRNADDVWFSGAESVPLDQWGPDPRGHRVRGTAGPDARRQSDAERFDSGPGLRSQRRNPS